MDEAGLKGYEASGWYGLYAPARTPVAIVRKLNETLVAALKLPETRERLNSAGLEPIGSTAEEFAAFLKADIEKYAKITKAAGIEPQ